MIIEIIVFQAIMSAIFSGVLAEAKKHEIGLWVFLGLIFGIFGLITIAGMPTNKRPKMPYLLPERMKCPKCNTAFILDEAERVAGKFTCTECNYICDHSNPSKNEEGE